MCVLPVPTSPMSTRSSLRSTKSSASSDSRPMPSGHDTVFLIAFIFRKSRDKSFGFHDDCFAS